ncbi:phage holin family protein [Pseudomonas sp. 681]|uniref:Phage holin family protein n=1 Tax=Pseudomonas fungipugnans TaxID=3024217 RepID=A0ABT6QVH8_9PSED|nr:phage holin family protein [Pseudomonas sp. 681]MDI2594284.1 phage holin family protein [Pseudomonas sp. 681]
MGDTMVVLVLVTGVAHLLSAFRLACYQRDEARHRWREALVISLCGGMFCLAGIDVLLDFASVSPWHAIVSVLSCALILRCGGNIALLWRVLKYRNVE